MSTWIRIDRPTIATVLQVLNTEGPEARFHGVDAAGHEYIARVNLWLIREAWKLGADFEDLADGFGAGEGTMGDWSAIRDSSAEAIAAMLPVALAHLQGVKQ